MTDAERPGGAASTPSGEAAFGRRFLDEYKRLGGGLTAWSYAEVQALKTVDREGLVDLLRERQPLMPYAALQRIRTVATPEELAADLIRQQQMAGAAVLVGVFAMFAMLS